MWLFCKHPDRRQAMQARPEAYANSDSQASRRRFKADMSHGGRPADGETDGGRKDVFSAAGRALPG